MLNEQTKMWTEMYLKNEMAYPSEYVIRIFKGSYPKLNFRDEGYEGKSILDVGCGDGRDLGMLKSVGFEKVAATEISEEIVAYTSARMKSMGVDADIRVGTNNNLGFDDEMFDYLLSWNVCYYMSDEMDFSKHVEEYARVMKKNGIFVFSIPCKDCFIYHNGIEHENGMMEITDDWFDGGRNGSLQRVFSGEEEIKEVFGTHFKDFVFGRISDDCFGLPYHWYIGYCRKK